jgi:hypothetical protein
MTSQLLLSAYPRASTAMHDYDVFAPFQQQVSWNSSVQTISVVYDGYFNSFYVSFLLFDCQFGDSKDINEMMSTARPLPRRSDHAMAFFPAAAGPLLCWCGCAMAFCPHQRVQIRRSSSNASS